MKKIIATSGIAVSMIRSRPVGCARCRRRSSRRRGA
jgi:hypothetical protein